MREVCDDRASKVLGWMEDADYNRDFDVIVTVNEYAASSVRSKLWEV